MYTGWKSRLHFRLANLYIFPSRYESYGLTLMEALQPASLSSPVIPTEPEHLVREEFGKLLPQARRTPSPAAPERSDPTDAR